MKESKPIDPQTCQKSASKSFAKPFINRRRFLLDTSKAAAFCAVIPCAFAQAVSVEDQSRGNQVSAQTLASDPRRPQFHLLPARNWMNDPNGPIFWKGRYHMFMQYNPHAAVWGDMHWYHSVSPDMLHWKHLPIALAPTPGGPDSEGCFSGTAVVRNGVPTFIYTGVRTVPKSDATINDGNNTFRETQLYATSTDSDLLHWTKRPAPVIANPPQGLAVTGFRDPSPWFQKDEQQDGFWYMAVGSGVKGRGGAVLLYKSPDLQAWEYQHMLTSREMANSGAAATSSNEVNPVDSGDMWECPDFFALNGKHVLIYSTQGKVLWQTGELDTKEMIFHPQQSGILDYGSFYAPKTQLDKAGNRILWGWIQETRPEKEFSASGWAGLMSLPRVLTVGTDGRLKISPLPTIDKLRQHEQKLSFVAVESIDPRGQDLLSSTYLQGACGELLCEIKPGPIPFTLDLINPRQLNPPLASQTPDQKTAKPEPSSLLSIRYSHANPRELVVDQQRLPINLVEGEALQLHFYIDGSVIELFVNNQITNTKRFYYPGLTAPEIALNFTGNKSDITRISQWQLTPISKDRLTTPA